MTQISRTLLPVNSLKMVVLDSRAWESLPFFLDLKQHCVPNFNGKI